MKNTTFRNGLTKEQANRAYEVFARVNLSAICRELGVNVSTIYNVLRDESPHVEQLQKVLVMANREIKRKERAVKKLPL